MIFIMHLSMLFAFSVLLASTVLYIWALRHQGEGIFLAKSVGAVIFILSLITILGIVYSGVKYWKQHNFDTPMGMSTKPSSGQLSEMRQNVMKRILELRKSAPNAGQRTPGAIPAPQTEQKGK